MGFCQQMTVLFAVSLDVICFGTKVTGSMWIAASIVVVAIIQYSVIQYEHLEVEKVNKKIQHDRHVHSREVEPFLDGMKQRERNDINDVNDRNNYKVKQENVFIIDSDHDDDQLDENSSIESGENDKRINTHIIDTIDSD